MRRPETSTLHVRLSSGARPSVTIACLYTINLKRDSAAMLATRFQTRALNSELSANSTYPRSVIMTLRTEIRPAISDPSAAPLLFWARSWTVECVHRFQPL